MNNNNLDARFASKREFHKEQAKLPFEQKVTQVIELQKIDLEFKKLKGEKKNSFNRVWVFDKK